MRAERSTGRAFRPDLQGLRAIAVLLVLVYHTGVAVLPGGYIGVDVFFVISGFLITGHLLTALAERRGIDFADFFARRARRILPAALVVAAATVAAGIVITPPLEQPRLLGDAIAAVLFVPNVRFAVEGADYLAEDEPSVFQHYWSLGVEEQFYLVWPALLALGFLLLRRAGRRHRRRTSPGRTDAETASFVVAFVAVLVIVSSLAVCLAQSQAAPSWAFFGLPARAWEFAAGGLLAALLRRRPAWLDGGLGAAAGWVGIASIMAAALAFNGNLGYPGIWAAIPVAGAVLAIAGGDANHAASPRAVLGSRPFVFVGAISYSLYLVHWPMQALPQSTLVTGGDVPVPVRLLLAAASVPLAWVMYRMVEVPFRRPRGRIARRPARAIAAGLAASAALAVVCLTAAQVGPARAVGPPDPPTARSEVPELAPSPAATGPVPVDLMPSLAAAEHDLPSIYETGCELGRLSTDPSGCSAGSLGPRVATFGDSHTAHWVPAFEELAVRGLIRLSNHSKSSCPSVDIPATFRGSEDYPECDRWRTAVLERLRADPPDVVVLANYAGNEFAVPDGEVAERWREGLERTIRLLPEETLVVVIAETPDLGFNPATCLSVHRDDLSPCAPQRTDALAGKIGEAELAATAAAGARLIDLSGWFCDASACPPVSGNVLVYRDSHHVTATFARAMADVIGAELGVLPTRRTAAGLPQSEQPRPARIILLPDT
ncbi:acyltransferase family protein [Agromyces albus]|uniref:acyltransferase family protein n=1 Tax=Agromyces albus TaxID=205332 RepID=UPI0013E91CEC|nr:acyltransferase family protein [Agromyces albus]